MKKLSKLFLEPAPFKNFALRNIARYKLGSFEQRVNLGAMPYAHYAYPLYQGAKLAKRLGHTRISTIEFGVAGGNGLVALEKIARDIEKELGMTIDVYGFDLSEGLPRSTDYRDALYFWKAGFFKMDVSALKGRLSKAKLVLGDVKDTIPTFAKEHDPAPIAAVMFDLDYYSSTRDAFKIFDIEDKHILPRVFIYFDDVMGTEECLVGDFTGQRAAINEFNDTNDHKKIDMLHFIFARRIPNEKYYRMRAFHHFKHPDYNAFIGPENQEQALR
ncbi:MAG: hypothetical protein JWN50_425 [Parcubacteria group bacterium]|nr:hypothetical protein [Parcubacteria group bacterium]